MLPIINQIQTFVFCFNKQTIFSLFTMQCFSFGGAEEIRTPDPLLAKQMLYQLSYSPIISIRW